MWVNTMSYSDLLDRMMERDTDAFMEMTDRYGWSLYNAIRKKFPDKAQADRIYNDTMQQFYDCLRRSDYEDPMEALLCTFAEFISGKKGFVSQILSEDALEMPPAVQVDRLMETSFEFPEKKKIRFGTVLSAIILVPVLAVSVWIIVGFLMHLELIPFYDFGYSWFCALAENWLLQLNII